MNNCGNNLNQGGFTFMNNVSTNFNTDITDNTPNASKVLNSLRYLDYTSETAILDIIDNSIDANAKKIDLWIISDADNSIKPIDVIDNGSGMDQATLNESIKLGSLLEKNETHDLGKFGMGLVTSSISLGRSLRVLTKKSNVKNFDCYEAIQDLDIIARENKFIKTLATKQCPNEIYLMGEMNEELSVWRSKYNNAELADQSGTIVSIEKIDKCEHARADKLAEKMQRIIGQTYRKFIQEKNIKFTIFVNKESSLERRYDSRSDLTLYVKAIDPIYDFDATLLNSAEIDINGNEMSLKVFELKDNGHEINRTNKMNIANQGFYVIRNNREISKGQTLSLFQKHNDYNLLRCELSFSGSSDAIAGTNFSKQKVNFKQKTLDKIAKEFHPYFRQVRSNSKKRQLDNRKSKEDFTDVEMHISKKSHLLKTPKVEVEKRNRQENQNNIMLKKIREYGPRLDITKRKKIDLDALKVRFDTSTLGLKGPLWESGMEKGTVIVKWNIEHPFYESVIAPNNGNPHIFNPIAYLVYCWAKAELNSKVESDSSEIIDNIRWEVGKDLSILIGS